MIRKSFLFLAILPFFISCKDNGENAKLKSQVDSLHRELETNQKMATTLQEVGNLMDSIDASRQLLRVNMVEGTSYDDYTSRMKDINSFVKDTQEKIESLEKELRKSKGTVKAYLATINKLKSELAKREKEMALLNDRVEQIRNENQNLTLTIDLQQEALEDKEAQIMAREQELAIIEDRIQEMLVASKMSEADAYYARARAIEESANRTKLAPRKKKESLKEALELYKKALAYGKTEAKEKIQALEAKLK